MRRIKFFIVREVGHDFDSESATAVLSKEVSDWLEIDNQDVSLLWSEISKTYKLNYMDRLVIVDDVDVSQEEARITLEVAKAAIEKAKEKAELAKKKKQEKKAQKAAQSLAEKKKLFESLKKELGE